jgi:hypothetical protein
MKQLTLFVVLILVVGVAGFAYRYVIEKPMPQETVTACTEEARVCPDGSSVGRTGPNCSFAACAFPNVEIPEAGISFAVPAGYTQLESGAPNQETLRIFQKSSAGAPHTIHVSRYAVPAGKTADQVILANTRYEPSDMPAADMSKFTTVTINGKQFRTTDIERFEGVVQSSYFLVRGNDVLRFDIVEQGADWTDPNLVVRNLPEHQALERMLATLQTN